MDNKVNDKKEKDTLNLNQKLGITLVIVALIILGYIIFTGTPALESIQKTKKNMFTGGGGSSKKHNVYKRQHRRKMKGGDVSIDDLKSSTGGCGCSEGGKY